MSEDHGIRNTPVNNGSPTTTYMEAIKDLRTELDHVRKTVKQAYQRLLISDGDAIALSMLKLITEEK